jgi:alcohol dehydrogenase
MDNFEYFNPVRVIFGNGKRNELGHELQGKYSRALIVCSKGPFRENGLFDDILAQLESAGIKTFQMNDIDSNPRISSAIEGADICKTNNIDLVVALGGGSTLDCSKIIAGAALTDMDPHRYLWPTDDKVMMDKALDQVFIPTMAATGTELNNTSVIKDQEAVHKSWCYSDAMFAKIVLMDPEVTVSVPMDLTIWGSMDILSHIFEFYFNGYDEIIFQKRFSEALILSTMEALELLVKDPNDLIARGELAWTSVMAWGGLTKIGRGGPDGVCHGIDPGIVSCYDMHHGAALGVITPRWMKFILPKAVPQFSRFARMVFGVSEPDNQTAAEKGVELFIDWTKKIGCPQTFADLGAEKASGHVLQEIAKQMVDENGGTVGQLVTLTAEEICRIYEQCWEPL